MVYLRNDSNLPVQICDPNLSEVPPDVVSCYLTARLPAAFSLMAWHFNGLFTTVDHALQIPGNPNFSCRQNMKQSLSELSWDSFACE